MRYAIISDLHANRPALKSVLADIASGDIDEIICLGDIVGYGPSPAEVLEIAYSKIHHFILGNHDAVIGGKLSPDCFNDNAKKLIEWTCNSLDRKAAKFFNSLPLDAKGGNFRCAHAEFSNPGRFGYILEPVDAEDSFKSCPEQVLFVGHSHVPGLFVMGDRRVAHWLEPMDFGIEDEKRYIVNVGSVGQPRDNDIRACYCIFDTEKKDVLFRKVAFDIEEYISEQKKNRLPETATYFIDIYHKQAPRSIRDIIDFHRVSVENSVKTGAETANLQKAVSSLKKTRLVLLILLVISAAFLFILVFFYSSEKTAAVKAKREADNAKKNLADASKEIKKLQKTVYGSMSLSAAIPPKGEVQLEIPSLNSPVSQSNPLKGWVIQLENPDTQKISVEKSEGQNILRLSSGNPGEISISSRATPVYKGMRFGVEGYVKSENFSSGNVEMLLEQIVPDGTRKTVYLTSIDGVRNLDKWKWKSMTEEKPIQEDGNLFLTIRGQFKGDILLRKFSIKRVD
ncbi:MAG TPA: hypothetical protein DCZ94_09240 [Lentisphaeria bacterium]|nr:MAG: hypothetical protein A2X48_18405 [Lentisphaerae bacterium GWF2_49_21]HBC87124.1 hypothetical protein [Lentisphaeria bacterium]